jgi:ribosomal protein L21E
VRLVLAGVLAATLLVTGASAANPDWKKLKYFHYDLYELALGTTSSGWSNAVKLPTSKAGFVPSSLPSWARDRGERVDAIWDDTCKKGTQKVAFTRSFLAPGDANEAFGWLTYSAGTGSGVKEVRVLLNGVLIAKTGAYHSGVNQIGSKTSDPAPLAAALKAFKFGSNALTIRVTKGPRSTGCGISFALLAKFGANVELGESRESAQAAAIPKYKKVDPGATVAVDVTGTIRNDGPASTLGGKFSVAVGGDMTIRGVSIQAGSKLADCSKTVIDPPSNLKAFECSFGEWHPGERERVRVVVQARVTDAVNYGERRVEVGFQVAGYAGARGAKGGGIYYVNVKYVACGPGSTEPNCKDPKGWG